MPHRHVLVLAASDAFPRMGGPRELNPFAVGVAHSVPAHVTLGRTCYTHGPQAQIAFDEKPDLERLPCTLTALQQLPNKNKRTIRSTGKHLMARRQKTSVAEDLMALVAMLPWWAGVILAAVAYVLLHRIADQSVTPATQPGQLGTMLAQSAGRTAALIGQYVLPIICLAGAGISAWKRHQRRSLVDNVVRSDAASAVDGMSWQQFEHLVGEAFRLQGYSVIETGGGGADGGVDLMLAKDGEKFIVQCKQWRALKVGVGVVRELYGVMAAKGSAGGFVVTSGRFTEEATQFANGRNIRLVDGPALDKLIRLARQTGARHSKQVQSRAETSPVQKPPAHACPVCSGPMVQRVAKRGTSAGTPFWGCLNYPACRGTRRSD